jgi:hypothetical protein
VPADLQSIVAAAKNGTDLLISVHYLKERLDNRDRPGLAEMVFGLTDDAPRISRDEAGTGSDNRGNVCDISCETPHGRLMTVRVNYEKKPMILVTAFYS